MDLRTAWRLSKTPYLELTFRSAVVSRGGRGGNLRRQTNPNAWVRSMKRSAVMGKAIISVFVALGTYFAFSSFALTPTAANLVGAVTLSLAVSLAYLVLYSLQVLPSFVTGGPYTLLAQLPMSEGDLSLVAILSIIRTFDFVIAAAFVIQVAAVGYLTSSVLAAGAMAGAAFANMAFGVAVAVWLAGVFQRRASSGGKGKGAAVVRFVFLISWGLAAASLGFLFNVVTYVLPILGSAISGSLANSAVPVLLSLVHPFSAGLAVASVVYPSLTSASGSVGLGSLISLFALGGYVILGYFVARRTRNTVSRIALGGGIAVVRTRATEFLLKVRRPLGGYAMKDVKVAAKNPSTAFVFALPIIETLVVALSVGSARTRGPAPILIATTVVTFFTLVVASVLLNAEGEGLEYTLSLPVTARIMILAKSAIATLAFLPVPIVLAIIVIFRDPSELWLVSIPFVQALSISAATSAELSFFLSNYKTSTSRHTSRSVETQGLNLMSAGGVVRLVAALVVSGAIALAPLGVFGLLELLRYGVLASFVAFAVVALAEFVLVQLYLKYSG